ncbi:MAG: TIGR00730 family Rossman fold protein [Balneolaceae bacterium]|nr:TIGR00730 family Rossman fold protein [Balneolaceae bacterium]
MKRVCVFCGSKTGKNNIYAEAARSLGKSLAHSQVELVYGGGAVGIMNEIANATLSYGGKVHGVIPEHLMQWEVGHRNLTALHVTDTMHERKAMMAELSDAFIALPGGFGTLEELMEVITWLQIEIHGKPVVLFNVNGYYNKLMDFISHSVSEGFIEEGNKALLNVVESVEECMEALGIAKP